MSTTLKEVIQAAVTQAVTQAVADAKLAAHPVGSYYWSSESTDPSILFGGTWERVKDRFVLAAGDSYAVGATGGEATHTLSEAELPKISGTVNSFPVGGYPPAVSGVFSRTMDGNAMEANSTHEGFSGMGLTFSAGGGQPHNNMPPYIAAYCWKRTA